MAAVIAENPIVVADLVDHGEGAKFLADAGVDRAGKPAFREKAEQPLLEIPNESGLPEKVIVHLCCVRVLATCRRVGENNFAASL